MWLFIEPIDVWLFRDGKPFTGGEDRVAHSLFPPMPFTTQGAIRAKILAERGVDLEDYAKGQNCSQPLTKEVGKEIGFPGAGYGKLRLKGPFLAKRDADTVVSYFPVPADVRQPKSREGCSKLTVLAPKKDLPFVANITSLHQVPRPCLLWTDDTRPLEQARGWLSQSAMQEYLEAKYENLQITPDSDLFEFDRRLGISVDSSKKVTQEGMLYQAEFVRLKPNVGLLICVEGTSLSSSGMLALGGESRAAKYDTVGNISLDMFGKTSKQALEEGRFKLVLTTPAYFQSGWLPSGYNKFFNNGSVKLVAAAIPKPINIGGAKVDIESQRRGVFHKPMYRFVPAGAVYFFEAEGKVTATGEPFTESPADEDLSQIGFGQYLIGRWDYV